MTMGNSDDENGEISLTENNWLSSRVLPGSHVRIR